MERILPRNILTIAIHFRHLTLIDSSPYQLDSTDA